ncbi:MAG: hypothetical protein NTV82_06990 [Candidatus Aminicenantes bacterium]|nr:hypothetical protein [Candidatus Aminicenantes bacterium]
MKSTTLIFAAFFVTASLAFSAQEIKPLSLAAQGIDKLEIDCGAGFLRVRGVEALNSIEVKAEIYVRGIADKKMKEFLEDHVKLTLEKKGSSALLVSRVDNRPFSFFREARIDLTVNIPKKMNIRIDDGSGSIDVESIIGNLVIEDGSGGIRVENIQGDLDIDDSSGEIEVRGVTGNVSIDDGSGGIEITDIGGSLTVSDGSGGIDIDRVGKDLILRGTGSGGVHYRNIKGRVIK